jgi:hypothetical protein
MAATSVMSASARRMLLRLLKRLDPRERSEIERGRSVAAFAQRAVRDGLRGSSLRLEGTASACCDRRTRTLLFSRLTATPNPATGRPLLWTRISSDSLWSRICLVARLADDPAEERVEPLGAEAIVRPFARAGWRR